MLTIVAAGFIGCLFALAFGSFTSKGGGFIILYGILLIIGAVGLLLEDGAFLLTPVILVGVGTPIAVAVECLFTGWCGKAGS